MEYDNLAKTGTIKNAMAMEAFITPFPSTAERTIADRMPGKAIMASTNLINMLSIK